jgi:hypothetical protein
VRADTLSGGIHAALVPSSADAAQALGGHLAGLNDYLAEHHTPVETLTMASPEGYGSGGGMDHGGSQGMNQGSGQGAGQSSSAGTESGGPVVSSAASPAILASASAPQATAHVSSLRGGHISVMA